MTKTRYKFLRTSYESSKGDMKWKVGKWYAHKDELDMCNSGFHCSKGIYQAFSYVQGEILTQVEVKGKSIIQDDKEVWEKMRIIKSWRWTKKDSVLFAICAARLVLKNFEKEYPNDNRPRKAIEAAEKYIKNPTVKNKNTARSARSAAWSAASAARSARSAARSTRSAAWSAESAARSARSAARSTRSAAWSAASAAWSAASAAWSAESAARSVIYKKLDSWMLKHLKNLRVLKETK